MNHHLNLPTILKPLTPLVPRFTQTPIKETPVLRSLFPDPDLFPIPCIPGRDLGNPFSCFRADVAFGNEGFEELGKGVAGGKGDKNGSDSGLVAGGHDKSCSGHGVRRKLFGLGASAIVLFLDDGRNIDLLVLYYHTIFVTLVITEGL